jgi:hypothetical protein
MAKCRPQSTLLGAAQISDGVPQSDVVSSRKLFARERRASVSRLSIAETAWLGVFNPGSSLRALKSKACKIDAMVTSLQTGLQQVRPRKRSHENVTECLCTPQADTMPSIGCRVAAP